MRTPIILDDSGDVQVFQTLEEAEAYLEPPDVNCPKTRIFDCEGLLLKPRISAWSGMKKLFGVISFRAKGERVVIEESGQANEGELRNLLVQFLSHPTVQPRLTENSQNLEQSSLPALIRLLLELQRA